MAQVAMHKVTAMPGSPAADSVYYVSNGTYTECYVTNNAGVAKLLFSQATVDTAITNALAAKNTIEIVDDIAGRDALFTGTTNILALVNDASADATVSSGSALYSYRGSDSVVSKVSEFESMDVTLSWGNITGGPTSTPAQIDSAVGAQHSHNNLPVLEDLSDSSGALHYKGAAVTTEWSTLNW